MIMKESDSIYNHSFFCYGQKSALHVKLKLSLPAFIIIVYSLNKLGMINGMESQWRRRVNNYNNIIIIQGHANFNLCLIMAISQT